MIENNNQEEKQESFQKGQEVEGIVSGITSFGAFIKLPNGEEGLVHISEISNSYVTSIAEFISLQDCVKIKILGKNQKGKWDLSMKQVGTNEEKFTKKKPAFDKATKKEKNFEEGSFDDLMDKFLKKSDEVQLDIRKNLQFKQGIRKKGKKGKFN